MYIRLTRKLFYGNWNRFRLLLTFVILIAAGLPVFSQTPQDSVVIYNAGNNPKIRYAKILGMAPDSICCLQLYEVLDKWAVFINTHPQKLKQQYECVFVQFIYYLAYNTKTPSDLKGLYNDAKTYRFKNPNFLQTGDIVFWGENLQNQTRVAIFLQNNIVVYPNPDGNLNFASFESIKGKNAVVLAKILKNE